MDVAQLERLICAAVARLTRAQQQAAPVLDLCYPRMVDAEGRRALHEAQTELMLASLSVDTAARELARASVMIANYLNPEAAGTDNSSSPQKDGE